jgi:GDP-L-fucose synthase
MDIGKLKSLGWAPKMDLKTGLADAYQWYVDNINTVKG